MHKRLKLKREKNHGKLQLLLSILLTIVFCMSSIVLLNCQSVLANAWAGTDEEWQALKEQAKNRQRRKIYNNDGDDAAALFPANKFIDEDTPEALQANINQLLSKSTSFLKKSDGIDTIIYNAIRCSWRALTRTEVAERHDFPPSNSANINVCPYLWRNGTDPLQLQIDFARQNDMEIFAEVRVNDTHDAVGTWEEPHSMMAQFKLDNPDYLVARNQSVYDIVCGKWTAYDFGQPAVREKFLAIVKDLIDNYAGVGGLDGIHFDLYRHGMFFRSVAEGGKASQEEIDAFTQIFADIHQYAEQKGKERGFPILISMRTPDSLGHCKDIGMDLEEWMRRGYVDLLMTTGYAKLESWQTMSDLCHGYGIKYYATDDTAGDSPMYNNGLPAEFKRRSQEAHFGRIASAFQEGADGIHYFNSYFQSAYVNFMRSDYASMAGATKRYYITQFTQIPAERLSISARKHQKNLPQLWCEEPALISPGKTNNYILESGDSAALIAEQGGQVEFLGILYGEISAPQNLQITTQGQEWTYLLSNGRVHYFKIPDTAILAGENEVSISISGEPCSDLDWKTLIQGDRKPSSGPKDGNFRRITNGGAEDLVDTDNDGTPDALAFIDDGTGGPGIFCALPIPGAGTYAGDDFDVNMRFDVQVVSASDDRAVVLRVGDGQHTEVISFTTDKISLLSSGVSVDYTTTEMKSYELQMTDSELILRSGNAESGYSEILRGTLEWTVDDSRAGFKGVDTHVNNLYGCGFYIGSMSNEGTGTAYWKNVAVGQPAGSEIIHDFCVESRSTPPLNPHPMKMCYDIFANYDPWHGGPIGGTPATYFQGYKSQKDSNDKWPLFLTTGNRRWQSTGVVVEVDINVTKGKVVLAASNGGEVIFQVIGPQYTIFPGDSGDLDQGPIALWTGAEPHTRRIDFHSNGKMNYFAFKLDEAGVPQASMNGVARNVTRFLNSSQAAFFTGDPNSGEQRILRWSGVLVKPMSDDAEFEMGQIRIAYDTKIADDNLRAALNEVLSEAPDLPENVVISPDSLITNCDLRYRIGDHPQKLDLSGRGICDLTGMDFALGLIELNLSHNNLSSPYPIRNISVLRKLDLSYNPLLSNTELQYITKRTTDLNLSGNPLLTDFSALGLATKTYLVNLTIDNGAVADISSLAAARDAATLLVRNQVVTIKPEESTFDNPIKGLDGSPVPLDSEWLEEVPGEVGKLRLKEGHPDNFGAGWSLSLKNAGGGDRGTFSGTLIVDTSEPLTVSVEKLWDDADNQDGLRPESIDISLFRAVGAADPALVETKSVTPDADGKWLASFTSLSKYEGMEEIVYTVDEAEVPTGYTKAITGTVAEGVTITNAHTPATVDIVGSKTWDDNDNQDGIRPANITINLYKKVGDADPELAETKTVTEADGWTWSFIGQPKYEGGVEIVYSIAEETVAEYDAEVDGYNITNSHTPATTSIEVTKEWQDADDLMRMRPNSITVQLYADGAAVEDKTLTLNEDNNWTGSFADLPVNKNGQLIVYTVDETAVPFGYRKTITGTLAEGFTITNTHRLTGWLTGWLKNIIKMIFKLEAHTGLALYEDFANYYNSLINGLAFPFWGRLNRR